MEVVSPQEPVTAPSSELASEEMTVSENHREVRSLTGDRKGLSKLRNQPSPRGLRAIPGPGTSHLRASVSSFRRDKCRQGVFTRQGLGPAWESEDQRGGRVRGLPSKQPSAGLGGFLTRHHPCSGWGAGGADKSGGLGEPERGHMCPRARSRPGSLLRWASPRAAGHR